LPYVPQAYFAQFSFVPFHQFLWIKHTGDNPSDMESIGDKDSAIAERVRALLSAANSTASAAAAAPVVTVVTPAAVPTLPGRRRLDSNLDPATVVANLTAAGIQLAVRKSFVLC
jgi:hypothetical protein